MLKWYEIKMLLESTTQGVLGLYGVVKIQLLLELLLKLVQAKIKC